MKIQDWHETANADRTEGRDGNQAYTAERPYFYSGSGADGASNDRTIITVRRKKGLVASQRSHQARSEWNLKAKERMLLKRLVVFGRYIQSGKANYTRNPRIISKKLRSLMGVSRMARLTLRGGRYCFDRHWGNLLLKRLGFWLTISMRGNQLGP